jgi:hypothetical protein
MSKLRVLVLASTVFGFLSCKSTTTGPSVVSTSIKGRVITASSYRNYTPPFSGIKVSVLGTGVSAMTDDSGYYTLQNVPQGTYNIKISKSGYGDILWKSVTITGGGNVPINWVYGPEYVTLMEVSNAVATITSAYVVDTIPVSNYPSIHHEYLVVQGNFSPIVPWYSHLAVYFSHTSDVSQEPGRYSSFVYAGWLYQFDDAMVSQISPFDTLTNSFRYGISLSKITAFGFHSGDSIYIATYGAPYYGYTPAGDYFDPDYQQYVLTALNYTPSPVVGIKLP